MEDMRIFAQFAHTEDGSSSGSGYGSSSGSGYGSGSGSGDGYGYGYGDAFGCDCEGVRGYNHKMVCMIDSITTILTAVRGDVAKGYILYKDLTLRACYVVKRGNRFAHGATLRAATRALQEKILSEMNTEDVIAQFLEEFRTESQKYPARKFYEWHHYLTGSCEEGRNHFLKEKGIDIDNDMFTVEEFIALTENAYSGKIIKELKQKITDKEAK